MHYWDDQRERDSYERRKIDIKENREADRRMTGIQILTYIQENRQRARKKTKYQIEKKKKNGKDDTQAAKKERRHG